MTSIHDFIAFLHSRCPAEILAPMLTVDENCHVQALTNFIAVNEDAWTSDTTMDLKKCITKKLEYSTFTIDLEQVFEYVSAIEQKKFWIFVSIITNRNPDQIAQERQHQLNQAVQDFANDLSKIDVNMSPQDIVEYVQSNKEAIQTRFTTKLYPAIPLSSSDYPHFWAHLEKIYNLLNPYDKIIFQPNKSHQLVTNIFDKMNSMPNSEHENQAPQEILQHLLSSDIMQQVSELVKDGGVGITDFLATMVKAIPQV